MTRASYAEPYLLLMIDLDAEKLAELALKVFPHGLPQPHDTRSLYVGDADVYIIDAAARLLELMAQPVDAELIAPLVRDEILIRLLRSPMGSRVAQIGQSGSSVQRVAKAVSWLRANFDQPANIEVLAKLVNMSVTSFHRQFKAVTGMSPLQYQKTLRLQEARRLMLTAMMDAGSAGRIEASLRLSFYEQPFITPPGPALASVVSASLFQVARRFRIGKQHFRRTRFQNHIAYGRIEDVRQILRRQEYDAVQLPECLQPIPHALTKERVAQVYPGFVERHQRGRPVEPLFDPPEQVEKDCDDGLLAHVHKVFSLEGQKPAVAEHVFIGIEQMPHRSAQRVVLECFANLRILDVRA